jgi:hypothetical protein
MLRTLASIAMAGALAGCDLLVQAAEDRAKSEIGNMASGLNLQIPADIKTGAMEMLGVPMIAGGAITSVNLDVSAAGSPAVTLAFTAPASPDAVTSYFVEQFRAQGIAASLAGDVLTGTASNGAAFAIRFAPEGTGTAGTIRIDPEPAR